MRKSSFSALALFFSFFLFSCSISEEYYQEYNVDTIRKTVMQISEKTYWTRDIDGSILSGSTFGAEGISRSITANPMNAFASGAEDLYEPVYPSLKNFPVLNTSALNDAARSNLTGFCNAVVERKSADYFMDPSSIYSLVIFNYDMNREKARFSSFVLGEPFISDTIVQCPVRFFQKDGAYKDVSVYLSPEKSFKIISLEFLTEEKEEEPESE
ncbi:MAG: hypothetical protein II114_01705 [Treponema sp.]|nr:hypothetical protein [Treponema sp.]MBQ4235767.1 hypothetical protein [Treponema sp.]